MCSRHGYAYLPNDPNLYEVKNPPPINKLNLCQECTDMMIHRVVDFPDMKGLKVWFNVTSDQTQRKLMLGRYVYLRLQTNV
jgi:hypothetical protein